MKSHPDNNSSRTITNIYHNQRVSIKTNIYKNTGPPQAKISHPRPKLNSVRFDDPYGHINSMENAHKYTDIIDTQEKYIEDTEFEQEEFYKDTMLTLSLKKNYNIFTHNLITIFQIQQ